MRRNVLVLLALATPGLQADINFAPPVTLAPGAVGAEFGGLVRVADLDADGRADLHLMTGNGDRWFLNRMPQGFIPAPEPLASESYLSRDLDGDGLLDQIVTSGENVDASRSRHSLRVRHGTGGGNFGPEQVYVLAEHPRGLTSVDLHDRDGDGDLDATLIVPGTWFSLRNGGMGFSVLQTGTFDARFGPLLSGDLDADGVQDFVLAQPAFPARLILRGAADGSLTPAADLLPNSDDISHVWIADFDGDTRQDLLVERGYHYLGSSRFSLLLRQPDGSLRESASFETADARVFGRTFIFHVPELADLDGDARPELVAHAGGLCSGPFACPAETPPADRFAWLSFGTDGSIREGGAATGGLFTFDDLDGDGRQDALGVEPGSATVVWRRSILTPNTPPVVEADQELRVPLASHELAGWLWLGAVDVDQQVLTYRVVSGPSRPGVQAWVSGGWLHYDRGSATEGWTDQVTVEVDDGAGGTAFTRIEVRVDGVGSGGGGGGPDLPALATLGLLLLGRRWGRSMWSQDLRSQ